MHQKEICEDQHLDLVLQQNILEVIDARLMVFDLLQMELIFGIGSEKASFASLSFAVFRQFVASITTFLSATLTPFAHTCIFLSLFSMAILPESIGALYEDEFYVICELWFQEMREWCGSCAFSVIVICYIGAWSSHIACNVGPNEYTMLEDKSRTLRTTGWTTSRKSRSYNLNKTRNIMSVTCHGCE